MINDNSVVCGDSFELIKQLPDKSVNLIFTSPPYADLKKYKVFKGIHPDNYCDWLLPIISDSYNKLADNGSFILNINDKIQNGFRHPYVFELVYRICKETKFKIFERLFWDKGKYLPNKYRFGDRVEFVIWLVKEKKFTFNIDTCRRPYNIKSINRMKRPIKNRYARSEDDSTKSYKEWTPNPKGALPSTLVSIGSESQKICNSHLAVFPVKFAEYFVKAASNEGDLVLDIFSGTGSTCVAAKKHNRRYLGFDNSSEYCNVSESRLENTKSIICPI